MKPAVWRASEANPLFSPETLAHQHHRSLSIELIYSTHQIALYPHPLTNIRGIREKLRIRDTKDLEIVNFTPQFVWLPFVHSTVPAFETDLQVHKEPRKKATLTR